MRRTSAGFDAPEVQRFLEPVRLPAATVLLRQDAVDDVCYVIDDGLVRIESDQRVDPLDAVTDSVGPGSVCGALSFIDGGVPSATAVAHTEVRARRLTRDAFELLRAQQPGFAFAVMEALAVSASNQARRLAQQLQAQGAASRPDPSTDAVVERATAAQRIVGSLTGWPEHRIDGLLEAIGATISDHAVELAHAAVAETGIGNAADKTVKNRFAAGHVVGELLITPGVGFRRAAPVGSGVTEFAAPVGVVLGLIPITNPTSTVTFKALIAVRSRNAIILSSHHGAAGVAQRTTDVIRVAIADAGGPPDLVQCLPGGGDRTRTARFMRHRGVGLILATGGPAMVKAAYSSGTPAIGVGSGNAPALVCADADLGAAARAVVASKSFDHGLICGSENHLVVEAAARDQFVAALQRARAAVLTPAQVERLTRTAFQDDRLRYSVLGQSAGGIATIAGLDIDHTTQLLVIPVERHATGGVWAREKLAPMISLFTVRDPDDGFALCRTILDGQGAGHTAVIHTSDRVRQMRFTAEMPASRIIANGPSAQGCIGLGNGLTPSMTLGCGTNGGTSTSDNITATHLLNLRRLAIPHDTDQ